MVLMLKNWSRFLLECFSKKVSANDLQKKYRSRTNKIIITKCPDTLLTLNNMLVWSPWVDPKNSSDQVALRISELNCHL